MNTFELSFIYNKFIQMTSSATLNSNQNKNKPKLKFPKDSDEESTESSNKVFF